jgi:hypothetical protein
MDAIIYMIPQEYIDVYERNIKTSDFGSYNLLGNCICKSYIL